VRLRLGHGDARPAGAACHIEDPRWRFGSKPTVDVDNCREPFCAKQVDEPRPGLARPGPPVPTAAVAARFQRGTPPLAAEASDRHGRCRRRWRPRNGDRRGLRGRRCALGATSTGARAVPPAGRRLRATHSRRAAQATPAHTAQRFQYVRPAATRWRDRSWRAPDTARVARQDKWCKAPRHPKHRRTAAHATRLSGQPWAADLRQYAFHQVTQLHRPTSPSPPAGYVRRAPSWNRLSSHRPKPSQTQGRRRHVLAQRCGPRPRWLIANLEHV
jgi:hypothetical protein